MDREDRLALEAGKKAPRASRGVDDYAYVNARVHALKATLLSRETLQRMLKAESLEILASILAQTGYAKDIKAAEQKYVKAMQLLDVLDDGLKQNYIRCLNQVRDFSEGEPRDMIETLLGKWDLFNLKTILRGKHFRLQPAEIVQDMLFAGSMSREYLEKLAQKPDALSLVEALSQKYPILAKNLRKPAEDYAVTGHLIDLEMVLDRWYYQDTLERCVSYEDERFKSMSDYVRSEIDNRNFLTVLRFVRAGEDVNKAVNFFIRGGKLLDINKFKELLKLDTVEKVIKSDPFGYGDVLIPKLAIYQQMDDIGIFERVLELRQVIKVRQWMKQDPLSFDVLISFFKSKYDEIINLRLILRAVEFGIPEAVIKEELVLV